MVGGALRGKRRLTPCAGNTSEDTTMGKLDGPSSTRVIITSFADFRLARTFLRGYNEWMMRAYEEIVEFIAAGTTPDSVARFEPSQESKDYVAELIHKEKTIGLTEAEFAELDRYLQLEHIMRLAKARAREFCAQ